MADDDAPILVNLEYDYGVQIHWKLENNTDTTKIKIAYNLIEESIDLDDQKNWKHQEFNIYDRSNKGTQEIEVKDIGVYLFKAKQYKYKSWSPYSNVKSVKIAEIKSKISVGDDDEEPDHEELDDEELDDDEELVDDDEFFDEYDDEDDEDL